jgi:hypothetical protein
MTQPTISLPIPAHIRAEFDHLPKIKQDLIEFDAAEYLTKLVLRSGKPQKPKKKEYMHTKMTTIEFHRLPNGVGQALSDICSAGDLHIREALDPFIADFLKLPADDVSRTRRSTVRPTIHKKYFDYIIIPVRKDVHERLRLRKDEFKEYLAQRLVP